MINEIAVIAKKAATIVIVFMFITLNKLKTVMNTNIKQAMPKTFLKALILPIR